MELHVPFDMQNGLPLLAREGGHGRSRILRCGGDATGLHLTSTLYHAALQRENIHFYDNVLLTDIVTDENGTAGVLALDENEKPYWFAASRVVLATGGIGRVYRRSTNSVCSTGDGLAAAMRAGAAARDMEFIQFHPTGFAFPREDGRYFLISEALRGEGAVLKNGSGEAFMRGVHPMADLAPRDIVARTIAAEMVSSGAPYVFLDITQRSDDFLKERFPTIFEHCLRCGIDMGKDPIPVAPVQHYTMGGIRTDTFGRTGVPGLYACGETACTGVHGANRLASNSLLECLVFGRRCALDIDAAALPPVKTAGFMTGERNPHTVESAADLDPMENEIREQMTQNGGIVRNGKDLQEAEVRIGGLYEQLDTGNLHGKRAVMACNMSEVALSILQAARRRKQSVGAHFRSDVGPNGGRQPGGPLKKTS
jgi:L-aspartate oxidase